MLRFLSLSQRTDKTAEERAHCFKHLSKSASELDSHDNYTNLTQPSPTPQRRTVAGVLQRTHGFLSTLKVIIAIYRYTQKAKMNDFQAIFQQFCSRKRRKTVCFTLQLKQFISSSGGRGAGVKNEDIIMHTHMDTMMASHMIAMETIMRRTTAPSIVARPHNHHAIDQLRMEIRRLQGPITANWTNVIH